MNEVSIKWRLEYLSSDDLWLTFPDRDNLDRAKQDIRRLPKDTSWRIVRVVTEIRLEGEK